jgi:DNA repair exonuclease SbcCD nuclease subunit
MNDWALIIGDPHLKASNLKVAKAFLSWIEELVAERHPDCVIYLGDVHHYHNVIRSEVLAMVDEHVAKLVETADVFVCVGNHEMAHHKIPEIHAWLSMKGKYKRLFVADKPFRRFPGDSIAFFPYMDDPSEFDKALEENKDAKLLFCHQPFVGADWGFTSAKMGTRIPVEYDGLIISGHIHKSQNLGCVWYPGSSFAQGAEDNNLIKGVYLFNFRTSERVFLPSPMPRWMTYRSTIQNVFDIISAMDPNDRNHLVIEGPGKELNSLIDSREFKDLKKKYNFSVKKESTTSVKSAKVIKGSTLPQVVSEYVDSIYDGAVDRDRLKAKCIAALS